MKYPENILGILRQRMGGTDEDDKSKDYMINKLSARQAFAEVLGWKFGDPQWAGVLIGWLRDCGFEVIDPDA